MAVNNRRRSVAYGLTDSLLNISPLPIVSQRAPLTRDFAEIGTIWIDVPNDDSYILTSIVANSATWVNAGGGTGTFNALVVTTTATIGTTLSVGGLLTANAGLDVTAGPTTITSDTNLAEAIYLHADAGTTETIKIHADQGTSASSINIVSDVGGITLDAASIAIDGNGITSMVPATDSQAAAAVTINANVGKGTFTGLTTASAGTQEFTITNSEATATSGIYVSAANEGANDAQMTITRVKRAAGSFVVTLTNNGAAALNGDVTITFWVID